MHVVYFLMNLQDNFEDLCRSILHRNPLSNVDSIVSKLLACEIKLKFHYEHILYKETLFTSPFIFVAFIHNEKPQGEVEFDNYECYFCNEKIIGKYNVQNY